MAAAFGGFVLLVVSELTWWFIVVSDALGQASFLGRAQIKYTASTAGRDRFQAYYSLCFISSVLLKTWASGVACASCLKEEPLLWCVKHTGLRRCAQTFTLAGTGT